MNDKPDEMRCEKNQWQVLTTRPIWNKTLWALAWLLPTLQIFLWIPMHLVPYDMALESRRDLWAYYDAAQAALAGRSPYMNLPGWGPHFTPTNYLYPPPFAAQIMLLGHLSPTAFLWWWYALIYLAFWSLSWAAAAMWLGRSPNLRAILGAGWLFTLWPGHFIAVLHGNAQILVNAMWFLSLLASHRDSEHQTGKTARIGLDVRTSPFLRGALLSLATQWKIQPFWALVLILRERSLRWPVSIVTLAGVGLGALVCGISSYTDWLHRAVPIISQGTFYPYNVSLSFLVLRLAEWSGLWEYTSGPLPANWRLYLSAIALLAPLIVFWKTPALEPRLRSACVVGAAVLFSPLCWWSYTPMLLPAWILWHQFKRSQSQFQSG